MRPVSPPGMPKTNSICASSSTRTRAWGTGISALRLLSTSAMVGLRSASRSARSWTARRISDASHEIRRRSRCQDVPCGRMHRARVRSLPGGDTMSLNDLIAPDTPIDRIAGGLGFTEGPVWRGRELLFSDIPNKRIVRWRRLPEGPELTTFATGTSNGLTLDRQGRVLAAEHDGRRVTRVADDGARTVLAEHFQGKRLNSPNDIVVKS